MSLNFYRDEAGLFLKAIQALDEPVDRKIEMLQQELDTLKSSVPDADALRHQTYDLLFLLFEIAFQNNVDLDLEWLNGQSRKKEKYL